MIAPVVAAGFAALMAAGGFLVTGDTDATRGGAALAFALAAIVAERFPVPVMGVSAGGVSLAAVFIVGAAVVIGWEAAVLVGVLARGTIELWQRRPFSRLSFNSATYALAGAAAGGVSALLHTRSGDAWMVLELAASAAAFWIANILLVAIVVARSSGMPIVDVVRRSSEGTIIPFGIMASLALILAVLWTRGPFLSVALLGPILAVALYQRSTHGKLEALQLAKTDPLTSLPNHRSFHERIDALVEHCAEVGGRFAVMLVDVDDFKQINDRQGHAFGDAILTAVGAVLGAHGEAFRLGGDEFAVLLPGASAGLAAERAMTAMEALDRPDAERVSLSIGVTSYPEHGAAKGPLVEHADQALYHAKYAGKGRVQMFDPDLVPLDLRHRRRLADRRDQLDVLRTLAEVASVARPAAAGTGRGELAQQIAVAVGLDADAADLVQLAHDVRDLGAFAISPEVLEKRAALSEPDWDEVRRHPEVASRMLSALGQHEIAHIVLHHHEHFDGQGYPRGLAGDAIPLGSRIVAVTDTLEALTARRPFRAAFTLEQALQEIRDCAGTQFDPRIVDIVERLLGLEPQLAATA
ncbi:MAG: diguanylate cyclase domain-containing protein [Gaiella sp.]